jgi:hypothetical protein
MIVLIVGLRKGFPAPPARCGAAEVAGAADLTFSSPIE